MDVVPLFIGNALLAAALVMSFVYYRRGAALFPDIVRICRDIGLPLHPAVDSAVALELFYPPTVASLFACGVVFVAVGMGWL